MKPKGARLVESRFDTHVGFIDSNRVGVFLDGTRIATLTIDSNSISFAHDVSLSHAEREYITRCMHLCVKSSPFHTSHFYNTDGDDITIRVDAKCFSHRQVPCLHVVRVYKKNRKANVCYGRGDDIAHHIQPNDPLYVHFEQYKTYCGQEHFPAEIEWKVKHDDAKNRWVFYKDARPLAWLDNNDNLLRAHKTPIEPKSFLDVYWLEIQKALRLAQKRAQKQQQQDGNSLF